MAQVHYGIFGGSKVEIDDQGFIEIPVIIQESGLLCGAPPPELRITEIGMVGEDTFMRQYVAMLNRKTDLPYYLGKAKVKVTEILDNVTDESNAALGIEPIE